MVSDSITKVWLGLKRSEENVVLGEFNQPVKGDEDAWGWNWVIDGVPAGRSREHWAGYYPGYSNWRDNPTRDQERSLDCATFHASIGWEPANCEEQNNVMCCHYNRDVYDCVESLLDKEEWPLVPLYIRDNENKDDIPNDLSEIVNGFATDHS